MLKRTIAITLCALLFLVACGGNQQPQPEYQEPPREGAGFENFPGVENVIDFLGLNENDITVFYDTGTRYIIGFVNPPNMIDEDLGEVNPLYAYVLALMESGFHMRLFDATVSSTFVVENAQYVMQITLTADAEDFKEEFQDISLVNKMTDENVIFDIRLRHGASSEETIFQLEF